MRTMTYQEWTGLALNSQMRHLLVKAMDDECLANATAMCAKNCTSIRKSEEPTTYEEALVSSYLPELLARLMERQQPPYIDALKDRERLEAIMRQSATWTDRDTIDRRLEEARR